jgi:hypothetical protein
VQQKPYWELGMDLVDIGDRRIDELLALMVRGWSIVK